MPTITDLIRYVEAQTGHPLNGDEGAHHGVTERELRRAVVCWMASPEAIRFAGEQQAELLIHHESLYYPYNAAVKSDNPPGWETWPVNRQRRELLTRYGLTALRIHGSADQLTIFDDFATLLELGTPVQAEGFVKVFEIAPCTLAELVERVKQQTGMSHLRVAPSGDPNRLLRRVGLPWGGLGLFVNVGYMQQLVAAGCDVFIAGESDSFGFRYPVEAGIPMIETSHEDSENPGLRHFTALLAAAFPQVHFSFYENPRVWEWQ